MRSGVRLLALAAAGVMLLAGCGAPRSAAPPKNTGPAIPVVIRVINPGLSAITQSGSLTLPLTGKGQRDSVDYSYSLTSPTTLDVKDAAGRSLLSLQNVQAVGAIEFRSPQLPLLVVTSSTNGQWGYPVTAYLWDPRHRELRAVPFSEPASPTALYGWTGKAFSPLTGTAAASTSLLGFATIGRSGLEVLQSVPQVNTPLPSNYTLRSQWIFTEPPATGWWILRQTVFGPNAAAKGQAYPKTALTTAEQYLTSLALGLPNLAASLASSSAQSLYGHYSQLMQQPGIGTPLPAFDQSGFNQTAVAGGQPGTVTIYVWSGAGIALKLSAFTAQVGLRQSKAGLWQVTALKLQPTEVGYATPASIVGLIAAQPQAAQYLHQHPNAELSVGVQSDLEFYANLTYPGAPASSFGPAFTINAQTGAVVYQGY